jgi:hypothetical protein
LLATRANPWALERLQAVEAELEVRRAS